MSPSPGDARLTWSDPAGERTLELHDGRALVTIGRSSKADVPLTDEQVSRRHAQLTWDGSAWVVRDLASTNGTRVGEIAVGAGLALADGDVVHCGRVAIAFDWPAGARRSIAASQPRTVTGSLLPPLTAAETTLLQALCRPYRRGEDPRTSATEPAANADVAERLRLNEDAVRQRLKRVYPKLGLHGSEREKRRELAALAIELGVVRPPA